MSCIDINLLLFGFGKITKIYVYKPLSEKSLTLNHKVTSSNLIAVIDLHE